MRRPGLTTRLFLAVLGTAVLVALALGVAAQWSFQRGFIGYLNDQAIQRMALVLPRLQRAYAEERSWDFLRDRPDVWFDLIGIGAAHPVMRVVGATPPAGPVPAMVASDLLGSGRRLGLLDAQRQRVMGFPFIVAGSVQREVVVDGQTVGWLTMAPVESVTDAASLRFAGGQVKALLLAGVLALLAAALTAWWVARALLAPVRRVARATHDLAAGAYATRVVVQGDDEVAQLGQDFNQLALTLERNERMRRDYMADVSHELRTPLAVLRGELEAMEDGVHPATPEALRALQAEVATLSQLVGDLHELALADVGALSYRKADLDLAALLAQEAEVMRPACTQAGLALHLSLPRAPVVVLGDDARLRQLLRNVMTNAVRYTDPGGQLQVRLQVGPPPVLPPGLTPAQPSAEAGRPEARPPLTAPVHPPEPAAGDLAEAWLVVEDSAPGVPPEALPRLFDRFFRVEASRGRATGGSGLGLAICRSIAEAHGGRLSAEPSALGGLCVRLQLPLLRHARAGGAGLAGVAGPAGSPGAAGAPGAGGRP